MTLIEKAAHAAERKAFEKVLDNFIQKGRTKDAAAAAQELVDMAEKIQGSVWKKESFEVLHMVAGQPEGKWAHYVQRILDETDPYILKTFLTNAVYEGGFRGYQQAQKNAEKYGCNIPWLILMDPIFFFAPPKESRSCGTLLRIMGKAIQSEEILTLGWRHTAFPVLC